MVAMWTTQSPNSAHVSLVVASILSNYLLFQWEGTKKRVHVIEKSKTIPPCHLYFFSIQLINHLGLQSLVFFFFCFILLWKRLESTAVVCILPFCWEILDEIWAFFHFPLLKTLSCLSKKNPAFRGLVVTFWRVEYSIYFWIQDNANAKQWNLFSPVVGGIILVF